MTKVVDSKERVIYYLPDVLMVEIITPRNVIINQSEAKIDKILGRVIFLDNHSLRNVLFTLL